VEPRFWGRLRRVKSNGKQAPKFGTLFPEKKGICRRPADPVFFQVAASMTPSSADKASSTMPSCPVWPCYRES
jgi:hypothetical protein